MSSKTHRWKSRFSMTQTSNKLTKSNKYQSECCDINVKFENSNYFYGSNIPYKFIFNRKNDLTNYNPSSVHSEPIVINKAYKVTNVDQNGRVLTMSGVDKDKVIDKPGVSLSIFTNDPRSPYKLQPSEYVEAECANDLIKLNNSEVRCYCISPIYHDISYVILEIERLKKLLFDNDWKSFRLLVLVDGIENCEDVLKGYEILEDTVDSTKQTSAVSSEYDEKEEAEFLQQISNDSKFRDSRYIKSAPQVNKITSNQEVNVEKVYDAMIKIVKTFDNGIEHAKKLSNDLKVEIEELASSIDEHSEVETW